MGSASSALASPGLALVLQSMGMFLGTLICGTIPLYLPLSKTKLRVLEVMGAGLLVGASMTVVLPEGVSALFREDHPTHTSHAMSSIQSQHIDKDWAWSAISRRDIGGHHEHAKTSPESLMGSALLGGFLVMFLIDQIAAPGAHINQSSDSRANDHESSSRSRPPVSYLPSHRPEALRLTRANSLQISRMKNADDQIKPSSTVESSPEQLPLDHDTVSNLHSPLLGHASRVPTRTPSGLRRNSNDHVKANGSTSQQRGLRDAFASIAGLVIHAAADGIAMGASAGSGDESLKLIVLFAIMIHKAPAAFGLCTLLMGQRLQKGDINKAIFVFSMSTPIGALLTYTILSIFFSSDSNGSISSEHIGIALTFSAGTFIFVAMHAVQELASAAADIDDSERDTRAHYHHHHQQHASQSFEPRQILGRTGRVAVFLFGTVLPKTLQSITGHGH